MMTSTVGALRWVGWCALGVLAYWLVIRLAHGAGLWCGSYYCHSNSISHGLPLWGGAVALALVGRACLSWPRNPEQAGVGFQLFTSLAIGLTVLMGYVYVRSLFNHLVVDLPITRWELGALVLMAVGLLVFRMKEQVRLGHGVGLSRDVRWLALDLVLLSALCVLVADREMPREIMLSSDPDLHVFLSKQIERFGAVPFQQREWGSEGFNYPAGSGVLLFLWHLSTGLDTRGLLAALPVLLALVAGLVIVESATPQTQGLVHRLIIRLSVLMLVMGALMFPHVIYYVHLEGAARQLSVLGSALFLAHALTHVRQPASQVGLLPNWVLPLLVFSLVVLNPANVVVAALMLWVVFVRRASLGLWDWRPVLALVVGLALLTLDPYFQNLLGIVQHARVDTVGYGEEYVIKGMERIMADALHRWGPAASLTLREFGMLLLEPGPPLFLGLLLLYGAAAALVNRGIRVSRSVWVTAVLGLLALYLVYGFAQSLVNDRRFYLLGPYVFFNMSQYKGLILAGLLAWVLSRLAMLRFSALWMVAVAVLLVWPATHLMRDNHVMMLDPRRGYCGAYPCIGADDRLLLQQFEQLVRSGQLKKDDPAGARVLLPNAIAHMGPETWIFPVTSARILPYHDVLPAAFYYFQGDTEFGAASYRARVCEKFDRRWLRSKGIAYVYLPTGRENACMQGMEDLVRTEITVLRQGNAYLLRLRPEP